jgi:hypothetical protein
LPKRSFQIASSCLSDDLFETVRKIVVIDRLDHHLLVGPQRDLSTEDYQGTRRISKAPRN